MFRGIHKLLPGHLLVFEGGTITTRQYWDVPARADSRAPSRASLPTPTSIALPRAARGIGPAAADGRRAARHVPLRRHRQQRDRRADGADDRPAAPDLLGRVQGSARSTSSTTRARSRSAIGAESHEIVIDDRDFFGALPKLVWHEDEPIAHPSSVPLYFVSALARQHVTVVLTGEGSDELLAGYGKYPRVAWNWRAGTVYERMMPARAARRRSRAASLPLLPSTARPLRAPIVPGDGSHAGVDVLRQLRVDPPGRSAAAAVARACARRRRRAGAYGASLGYFNAPNGTSTLLDRLLYADIKTYLVELLMKQDQMSMAASIESRVPFLDHKLVEFAATLPDEWKLTGWTTKRVLRESMKGLLPESILNRPKMGFPVPFAGWTRGGWNGVARDVLLDRRSRERGHHRSAGRRPPARPITPPAAPTAATASGACSTSSSGTARSSTKKGSRRSSPMRILWLKSDLLLPLDKGGKLRTWHLMRHLARRHEITYLAFKEPGQPAADVDGMREVAARVETVTRAEPAKGTLPLLRRRGDAPRRSAAVRGRQVPVARVPAAARTRCSRRRRFDLIVCDFLFPAVNLPKRLPCPAVIFTHNVESEIWRRHAETKTGRDRQGCSTARSTGGCCATKRRTLARFDGVLAVSDADRETFARALSRRDPPAGARRPDRRRHRLLRAGAERSGVDARWSSPARWTGCRTKTRCSIFCRDILPLIRAEEPDVTPVDRRPRADAGGQAARRRARRRRSPAASTTCGRT